MNARNWEALLLATLRRARDVMPGPGCTPESIAKMKDPNERSRARVGVDIDDVLDTAAERASAEYAS